MCSSPLWPHREKSGEHAIIYAIYPLAQWGTTESQLLNVVVMGINFGIVLPWRSQRRKGWCHWGLRITNIWKLPFSTAKVYRTFDRCCGGRYMVNMKILSCFMLCNDAVSIYLLQPDFFLQKRKHQTHKWWFIDSVTQDKYASYGKSNLSFWNTILL